MRSFFLFVVLLLTGVHVVEAHPLLQNAMWVQFEASRVHVAINVSVREIMVAQGLPAEGESHSALPAAAERHRDYVLKHLQVSMDGRVLVGQGMQITAPSTTSEPETTYYQYELEFPFDGPPPAKFKFTQDMLREWPYAVGTPWEVNYLVRLKRADSDEITTALLRANQPTEFATGWQTAPRQASPATGTQGWQTFREYLWHGVTHILDGWDHLLFVAALVIATMSFWELVKVIAAFTVAHTITLTLSVFDVFRLPPWVVEPVIALSIIFVALENVLWPRRAHSQLRLGVAFGFGLVHGLGFAGSLLGAMEGLPRIGTWIALGAFSLGVEIGHQIVVLPLFAVLALGRQQFHERFTRPALRYGSIFISLCGVYYLCVALRGH